MDMTSVMLDWFKKYSPLILSIPAIISALNLIGNILLAVSDWSGLDEQDFHDMLQIGSWIQLIILLFIMSIFRLRK